MKLYCVIACYRPDLAQLALLCRSLLAEGAQVHLVDNSEEDVFAQHALSHTCLVSSLGYNSGIAHAQNVGVRQALNAGADIVVFFDQDSQIDAGFLSRLTAPMNLGTPDIVSPLYYDASTSSELPSQSVSDWGVTKTVHGTSRQPYEVDVVISSGTAATKEVFPIAGGLDERLFIDFVDTEWCLRCRSKKIPIRVVPSAVMRQRIGAMSIRVGPLTVLVHSPVRCYYQFRNSFHLFRKKHIPFIFALREMLSVFGSRFLLLFFVKDRRAYLRAYLWGVWDGLRGVGGPCRI